jgi:1-pyrroline-5-carboxylate dehydrogenase
MAVESLHKELGRRHPIHIGDEEVFADGDDIELRSPVDTRVVLGRFQKATKDHILRAISAANDAAPSWASTSYEERVRIFRRAADILERKVFHMAALTSYEVGKSRLEALAEVFEVVDWFRYYCDQLEANEGYLTRMQSPVKNERCVSVLKPYGTWAVISPFNFPVALANNMCAGALMMANTVVFKPTSAAPFSGLKLYQIYREAGVPAGAVNFITGSGKTFGEVVSASKGIDGVAFVGSMEVGTSLQRQFAERQPYTKPFISEMGSKNPAIVSDEANLDKAAAGVLKGAFGYQGQKCSATSGSTSRRRWRSRSQKCSLPRLRSSRSATRSPRMCSWDPSWTTRPSRPTRGGSRRRRPTAGRCCAAAESCARGPYPTDSTSNPRS